MYANNLALQTLEENFQVIEIRFIKDVVWMFKILFPDTVKTVFFSGSTVLNTSGVAIYQSHVNRNC